MTDLLTIENQAAAAGINLEQIAPWVRAAWCLGWGGPRIWEAMNADPRRPPWRTAWCWQPPGRRLLREIEMGEITRFLDWYQQWGVLF